MIGTSANQPTISITYAMFNEAEIIVNGNILGELVNYISCNAMHDLLCNMSRWEYGKHFELYAVMTISTSEQDRNFVFAFDITVMDEELLAVTDDSESKIMKRLSDGGYKVNVAVFIYKSILRRLQMVLNEPYEFIENKFFVGTSTDKEINDDVSEVDMTYYKYYEKANFERCVELLQRRHNRDKFQNDNLKCMTVIMSNLLEQYKSISDSNEVIEELQSMVDKNKSAGKYLTWHEHIDMYTDIIKFLHIVHKLV
jgi:hypothetical protein